MFQTQGPTIESQMGHFVEVIEESVTILLPQDEQTSRFPVFCNGFRFASGPGISWESI